MAIHRDGDEAVVGLVVEEAPDDLVWGNVEETDAAAEVAVKRGADPGGGEAEQYVLGADDFHDLGPLAGEGAGEER